MMKAWLVSLGVAASVVVPFEVYAQEAAATETASVLDQAALDAIEAACTVSPDACQAAVAALVAQLGSLPEALRNSALGMIGAVVAEVAVAQGAGASAYAAVLGEIASASTNPEQKQVITAVVAALATGNVQTIGQTVASLQQQNASPS